MKMLRLVFRVFCGPLCSPKGLLVAAALLAVAFAILHLAGGREYATVITGTSPTGNTADIWALSVGVLYVLLYLAWVVLVPILVLASIVLTILHIVWPARGAHTDAP